MRSLILFSHKLLLFCLVTLSLFCCGVSFTVAATVSTGTVNFKGSEVTANIPEGAHYKHDGKRKLSGNVQVTNEGVSRRVVLEEKWKAPLGKAPDITVFTFTATAFGQGRVLLTLKPDDGGATVNFDVGEYKGPGNPYSSDENDADDFPVRKYVPHENIREYEDGFDSPYDDDCVAVKHKGYDLEVVTGQEDLKAKGKAYTEKISIAYGKEKETQKALGLSAGWHTASIDAGFVKGNKSTWGWKLVEHSKNESGESMDSTFSVTVEDIISAQEGGDQPPCEVCDHCGDYVHTKEDHKLGSCPHLDPSVAGCGVDRWSCETSKEKAWHQIRTCDIGFCRGKFRHCQNPMCWERAWRGHDDGSTPEVPDGLVDSTPTPTPAPTPTYHVCGVHEDWQSGDHSLQASCSVTDSHGQYCTVTNFYVCQYHTHQYPALISGACGHSYTSSASYNHRLETCPTNANGDSCTSGSFYACQSHTHVYPQPKRTCWRTDCDVEVSNSADHKAFCGSGDHSYWPGCPDLNVKAWHQHSYHELRNCSRCTVQFRLCSNTDNSCIAGGNHRK